MEKCEICGSRIGPMMPYDTEQGRILHLCRECRHSIEVGKAEDAAKRDTDRRATCPHEDAVFWNPYNKIVQCHRCGETFVPISAESIPYARIAVENTRGSGAGTVRFTRIDTPLITVEPTQGSASTTLRIYNWDDFK